MPEKYGADRVTRTPDPRITNALLYQLSYIGTRKGAQYSGSALSVKGDQSTLSGPIPHPDQHFDAVTFGALGQAGQLLESNLVIRDIGQLARIQIVEMVVRPGG